MSDAAHWDGELADAETSAGAPAAELRLLPFYGRQDEPFKAAEPPRLSALDDRPPQARRAPPNWRRIGAAASLVALLGIGAAAAAAHVHGLRVARAEAAATRALTHRLDALDARLEALDANRSHDDLANMRKVVAEIKAGASSARDLGGAMTALAGRVDKLEKDEAVKLDKLGDRLDHDTAARLAEVTARLDRLEAKSPVAAAARASVVAKADPAKSSPPVAMDATGSIDRPVLRNFRLAEIHNGYAMIDSPEGHFAVAPGDFMPGGARVLRIERRGRDWVVVTTIGQIVALDE